MDIHTRSYVTEQQQQQHRLSIPSVPTLFVALPFLMTGAAQRRKQRRLRSWWRHEQQSIAAALATSLHHSSRGQRKARTGGGERVALHGQGPEDSSSPAGALQPVRRRARREAACQPGRAAGAAGAGTATHHGAACRRRSNGALSCCTCAADGGPDGGPAGGHDQGRRLCGARADYRIAQDLLAIPLPRTVLREPQKAEQLVEVPVPAPSFSDWFRWEDTYRRTGHTWLGGFEWCLTASPGRKINSGPGPRRRPGTAQPQFQLIDRVVEFRGRGCPTATHSAICAVLGCAGELQRQVPAVPRRL